ncbi:MAG: septum formation inhibitor Maf [Verrucomicrobiales bacterium]
MKWILTCLFWATSGALLFADSKQIRDFWFAGAEINSYELSQSRYGESRPGHAELIFVTEPFLLEKQVKDESGRGESTDVLKLNALTTFNTGIYSYRTMTSTFRPIEMERFPHALKSATSIQDWCGHAYQQMNYRDGEWSSELRSYFESFGDQDLTLGEAFLEDELWITLRLNPEEGLPIGKCAVIPGALFTRFHHQPISIQQAEGKLFRKNNQSIYVLSYSALGRSLSITFDTDFPHIIREWKEVTPKGTTTAVLKKRLMNSNYWSLNKPEDSKLREQLGLEPVAD